MKGNKFYNAIKNTANVVKKNAGKISLATILGLGAAGCEKSVTFVNPKDDVYDPSIVERADSTRDEIKDIRISAFERGNSFEKGKLKRITLYIGTSKWGGLYKRAKTKSDSSGVVYFEAEDGTRYFCDEKFFQFLITVDFFCIIFSKTFCPIIKVCLKFF